MTDRENLPAATLTQAVSALSEQRGSLVTRGMAAVNDMKHQLSLTAEPDAEKLFKLGMHYLHGDEYGMPSDIEKAYEYLLKAAKLDHAEGQYELSHLLEVNREDIENWDGTEPVQWLESSAILGFGPAQYELAKDYELPEEEYAEWIEKALAWYKTQAEAGNKVWQYEYAMLLLRDDDEWCGDPEEGLQWLTASAEQGYRQACHRLSNELLKFAPIAENVQKAIHWLEQAAELGDVSACVDLAEMYLCGHRGGLNSREPKTKLVEIDLQTAVYWYERGIQLGWSTAAYKLGREYLYGRHLPQNLELAKKWLLHSAMNGDMSAPSVLGSEYASGLRLRQDTEAAIYWLKLAAEHRKSTGLKLADIYLDGEIVPRNFEEAIKWLTCAADGGFRNDAMKIVAKKCFDGRLNTAEETTAQAWLVQMATKAIETVADTKYPARDAHNAYHLGELYELGLGVEQNMGKAIHWYRQSAEQDLFIAKKRLDELGIDWKNT